MPDRVRESLDFGGLPRRLGWLLYSRLGIAVLGMGAIYFHQSEVLRTVHPTPAIEYSRFLYAYYVLLFAFSVNLLWLLAAWAGVTPRRLALAQIAVDVLCEALLVYFTGGVGSIFASLFFATVLSASMLVSARAGILSASVSTICLSAINLAYSYVWYAKAMNRPVPLPLIPEPYVQELLVRFPADLQFILSYLVVYAISLHVVALLSGWLVSELRHVRILNEEILHNMVGGVLTVDADGRLVFANAQARALLGLSVGTAQVGISASEVLAAPSVAPLRALLEEPRAAIVDLRIPRPGLPELEAEATTSLLTDDRGRVRGVVVLLRDVGLQHEIERARRRNERLQALSEMSAGMAHEIRTPLSSIRGSIQELQSLPSLSSDDRRLMSIILKESDRLNQIITNFLEYAREQTVTHQRCDLGEVLREVALQLEKDERNPGVKVVADLPESLACRGEAALLKQVFLNLGVNAMEASRPGGEITIRARQARRVIPAPEGGKGERPAERSGVAVEFIDRGEGIDPVALGQIYDPFFTTKAQGTGMGLAIASRIVQVHDGALTAASVPGEGSTFTVWLPG